MVSIVVWVWVFGYRVVDLGFQSCDLGLGFRYMVVDLGFG